MVFMAMCSRRSVSQGLSLRRTGGCWYQGAGSWRQSPIRLDPSSTRGEPTGSGQEREDGMKRILGSMLLLTGLGGCIAPTNTSGQYEKVTGEVPGTVKRLSVPTPNGFVAQQPSYPVNTTWTANPGHMLTSDSGRSMNDLM